MEETYKLKVNDEYEFLFTPKELASLDLIQLSKDAHHLLDKHQTYQISMDAKDFNGKKYSLSVNNTKYQVSIADPLDLLIDQMGFELGSTALVNSIEAPMPGLILELLVTAGQEVQEGDGLLILEAMKMENMISSPRAGKVKSIAVAQGDAVEKKQVLITFE